MATGYRFYFEIYASGRRVGRSRVFEVLAAESRAEATRAAEEAFLETGALRGDAFTLDAPDGAVPDAYTLRDA
jgi:hypothetical protein